MEDRSKGDWTLLEDIAECAFLLALHLVSYLAIDRYTPGWYNGKNKGTGGSTQHGLRSPPSSFSRSHLRSCFPLPTPEQNPDTEKYPMSRGVSNSGGAKRKRKS